MNNRFVCVFLLISACLVSAMAQVLLKQAAQKKYDSFIKQYLNIKVAAAYSLFFLVIAVNTYILRFIPMSVLGPVAETLPYMFSFALGRFFFNEKITARKLCGGLVIAAGIIVILL